MTQYQSEIDQLASLIEGTEEQAAELQARVKRLKEIGASASFSELTLDSLLETLSDRKHRLAVLRARYEGASAHDRT